MKKDEFDGLGAGFTFSATDKALRTMEPQRVAFQLRSFRQMRSDRMAQAEDMAAKAGHNHEDAAVRVADRVRAMDVEERAAQKNRDKDAPDERSGERKRHFNGPTQPLGRNPESGHEGRQAAEKEAFERARAQERDAAERERNAEAARDSIYRDHLRQTFSIQGLTQEAERNKQEQQRQAQEAERKRKAQEQERERVRVRSQSRSRGYDRSR